MKIDVLKNEDSVVLAVDGRIDTITAPELQKEVLGAFQKTGTVTMDLAKVEYVSSAGLRVLLIGQKTAKGKGGSFTLTNVCEQVMTVFEMTGFKGILNIQ